MNQVEIQVAQNILDDVERMCFLINRLKAEHELYSVQVARAPLNYFDLSLEQRASFLKAPSTFCLCKTIVMQNSKYAVGIEAFPEAAADPTYHKNVIVITQFEAKLNATRIVNIMKQLHHN